MLCLYLATTHDNAGKAKAINVESLKKATFECYSNGVTYTTTACCKLPQKEYVLKVEKTITFET
jgi:hypothetical protein